MPDSVQGYPNLQLCKTGSEVLTFRDVAEELSEGLGQRVEFVPLSPEASEEDLRDAGMAEPVPSFVDYFRELSSEDTTLNVQTDAVEEVTGRPPRSLGQFAADHAGVLGNGGPDRQKTQGG